LLGGCRWASEENLHPEYSSTLVAKPDRRSSPMADISSCTPQIG
jgi:hypothetical protein